MSQDPTAAAMPGETTRGKLIPAHIGAYRIVRQLGRGGMGVVYEAEQQQPRRPVALKVVEGGAFLDQTRIRLFEREAQALARLKHPNIAAIYESGCTPDGKHFFAMELARGETLGEYLERTNVRLPLVSAEITRRLVLFRKICDAVNYAHQRGIIHRDLKPGNIVVLRESASSEVSAPSAPEIKILDFGLARITDQDLATGTMVTALGQVYGTVSYMSPEQFRGSPDEVDTRTDVYSLGVVLYQMLTGRLPIPLGSLPISEAARSVRDLPPAPLTRGWLGPRRPDPDLQTIVGKTLEKEPQRRYQNVAALSEDVERYLKNQPILARPPSTAYQLRKMIARHKAGFGFAAALLTLVAGFGVTMAVLSARVATERDHAQKEAARANAINAFLLDTLGSANPFEGQSRDATVLEALKTATAKLDSAFVGQPGVEGRVRATIGITYLRLGHYDEAEPMLRSAIRLLTENHGMESADLPRALSALATLRQERGDLTEAETLYRRGLAIVRSHRTEPNQDEMDLLSNLADLLKERNELPEAEKLMRESLAFDRRTHGVQDLSVAIDLNNLGTVLVRQERFAESEPLLREAVAIFRKLNHAGLIIAIGNHGEALTGMGRYPEAIEILKTAVSLGVVQLGEKSQDLAKLRVKYAVPLVAAKQYAVAEEQILLAIPVLRASLGDANGLTQRALRLLVDLYIAWGKDEKAGPYRVLIPASGH